MGIYAERSGSTLLAGAVDPHGRSLFVTRVNGQAQSDGQLYTLANGLGGSVSVSSDGVVTFDDSTTTLPGAGQTVNAGSFTYRLGNGVAESRAYSVQVDLTGKSAAATFPASSIMAFDTNEVVTDGANRVSQWTDQTGNGHHLYQDVAENRPLLSTDANGALRIHQTGSNFEHLKIPPSGVPKNSPIHMVFAFREDSAQRGYLITNQNQFQYIGLWWENTQGVSPMQEGSATFLEAHAGGQILTPSSSKADFGIAHRNGNVAILRDLVIPTSGSYPWQDMILLSSFDPALSAYLATNNLTGGVYAFAVFTDWADAEQAERWAVAQVASNRSPIAADVILNFDAGANS